MHRPILFYFFIFPAKKPKSTWVWTTGSTAFRRPSRTASNSTAIESRKVCIESSGNSCRRAVCGWRALSDRCGHHRIIIIITIRLSPCMHSLRACTFSVHAWGMWMHILHSCTFIMHACFPCMHVLHPCTFSMHPPFLCMHVLHACMFSMHARSPCMHLFHACMFSMHACSPCMHVLHACTFSMHVCSSCMHFLHAFTFSMHAQMEWLLALVANYEIQTSFLQSSKFYGVDNMLITSIWGLFESLIDVGTVVCCRNWLHLGCFWFFKVFSNSIGTCFGTCFV